MRPSWIAVMLAVLGTAALLPGDDTPAAKHPAGAHLFPADQMEWTNGPDSLPKGAQVAVLEGDPSKEGHFVFRIKVPDAYRIPPHTHPKPERITVISGTLNIGMGETFDEQGSKPLRTGAFGRLDADMAHFAWTKGETVLQLHGEGPWLIRYINPKDDPRNQDK